MTSAISNERSWLNAWSAAWNEFWFSPTRPETLCLLRILAGGMLFYTHLIWSLDLLDFLGPQSWVSAEVLDRLRERTYAWSYLWYLESPTAIWTNHLVALAVLLALFLGFQTRIVSVLAAIITLSYCHRLSGALYGLDQVNAMFALYLAVGPSGAVYSVDRWLSGRRGEATVPASPSVASNIAIRLIQVHMCVIYLFGGIGKMRGEMWWDGSAVWFAVANYEYQSWSFTWLVEYPFWIALATHITVFWETFYPFLVWNRLTRPIALGLAVMVHGGIALALGMPTFGLAMIFGNMAFLEPETVRRGMDWLGRVVLRSSRAGSG